MRLFESYNLSNPADLDEIWDNADELDLVVTEDLIPPVEEMFDYFEEDQLDHLFTEERRKAVDAGAAVTPSEYEAFRQFYLEYLRSGDADADYQPGYALKELKTQDGNRLWVIVLRTGYSFSDLRTWLGGIYKSKEEALRSVGA
jgi:hypothetical protein